MVRPASRLPGDRFHLHDLFGTLMLLPIRVIPRSAARQERRRPSQREATREGVIPVLTGDGSSIETETDPKSPTIPSVEDAKLRMSGPSNDRRTRFVYLSIVYSGRCISRPPHRGIAEYLTPVRPRRTPIAGSGPPSGGAGAASTTRRPSNRRVPLRWSSAASRSSRRGTRPRVPRVASP